MRLNLPMYTRQIKLLMFIPILVGAVSLIELVIPLKQVETTVVDKSSSYRAKYDRTIYTIEFDSFSDQFSEEVFNSLEIDDEVTLYATFFNEEVETVVRKSDGKEFEKGTSEVLYVLGFALVYIALGTWVWASKAPLRSMVAKISLVAIILSGITFIRILVKLLT